MKKIVALSDLIENVSTSDLLDVSLCFGHFNVIHPGHLRYFQIARTHGKRLVVALESDQALSQTQIGEWFPESERASAVAALEIVDHVVILDTGTLEVLVSLIKPQSLVLGREFEQERSKEVEGAVNKVYRHDGQVIFAAGEARYATSGFLYGKQDELETKRWQQFQSALMNRKIDLRELLSHVQRKPAPQILVLGDTIVDQYVACDPIGMSNEAPVVVVKEIEKRDFIGGAAIVAAHVASLGANCSFLSVSGDDQEADLVDSKLAEFDVTSYLIKDPSRPTTSKIRYMVENQKLFRVSRLKEHSLSAKYEAEVIEKLIQLAPSLNGIVVCDFVYGVITTRILDALADVSRKYQLPLFGDLQCSSQIGNVAKFQDFQLLCPTEREARISLGNKDDGVEYVANMLMEQTRSSNLIIKLGAEGLIAYGSDKTGKFVHREHFPALVSNPVDVAGAGDSLLAAVTVALSQGLPIIQAAALGSCVSAIAVQTVGNVPVTLEDLDGFIERKETRMNEV